jgi:hypothetical protein
VREREGGGGGGGPERLSDCVCKQATVKATLGAGNLQEAVLLPEGEDKNEWLAVNTVCVC